MKLNSFVQPHPALLDWREEFWVEETPTSSVNHPLFQVVCSSLVFSYNTRKAISLSRLITENFITLTPLFNDAHAFCPNRNEALAFHVQLTELALPRADIFPLLVDIFTIFYPTNSFGFAGFICR
jgi:hypothetical protein